jgi:hypothetical protein
MGVLKFILHLLGWLITVIFQVAVSYLIILLFSILLAGVDTTSRTGWVASLLIIWLGYIIGINLVGFSALRWAWKNVPPRTTQRLIGTAIGALIPFIILIPIGFSVPVGDAGSKFYDLVTNNWQPILAQASLFMGIVGYFVPGMINLHGSQPESNSV